MPTVTAAASDPSTPAASTVGTTYEAPVESLRFDLENPRFVDFAERSQAEIVRFLYDEADLNELIQSISASGFISYEPLLVMREGEHRTVLEGNRRLGAVLLLRSPELRAELRITVPALAPERLRTLDALLVHEVANRAEARAFIGFKHINGPHKWDSLAKAKYAAEWLADGGDIQEIARTLGDTHNTVRRLVFGWLVLKQAEDNGFDRDQRMARRFAFSHLYTALARPGFRSHIGLSEDPSDTPLTDRPVPPEHLDQLRELMGWLYGNRGADQPALVRSQNPDLNRLNDVLQHGEARRYLLATRDLAAAYEVIAPRDRRFADSLIAAVQHAKEALSLVTEYDRDPALLENARVLDRTAKRLVRNMEDEISAAPDR